MDNRDCNDGDRKGKRPVRTSESGEDAVWNTQNLEKWQTTILKAFFSISKDPSIESMAELTRMTGLTHRQVQIWFNNKHCVRRRLNEEGESSNSGLEPAVASENIIRDEPPQDVERVVHMPMWRHGRLVRAGVLVTYRRRHQQQSSMQHESRSMPVHENQDACGSGVTPDNNMAANPVNAPRPPGDLEQEPIEQETDSDSASEAE